MFLKADPDEFFKTKALIRNSSVNLAIRQIFNLLKQSYLVIAFERQELAIKEMLKMKDDPDELLKTKDVKMTLFDIPMSC